MVPIAHYILNIFSLLDMGGVDWILGCVMHGGGGEEWSAMHGGG